MNTKDIIIVNSYNDIDCLDPESYYWWEISGTRIIYKTGLLPYTFIIKGYLGTSSIQMINTHERLQMKNGHAIIIEDMNEH